MSPSIAMPRSSSSPHRSTIASGGSPSSPVRATIRSVPPAIGRAGPVGEDRVGLGEARGLVTGGSTGIGAQRPRRTRDASDGQQDERGDDAEPDRELLRRDRDRGAPGRSDRRSAAARRSVARPRSGGERRLATGCGDRAVGRDGDAVGVVASSRVSAAVRAASAIASTILV